MPSTGMPRFQIAGSQCGAPLPYTLAGPPLRISPFGLRVASFAAEVSNLRICENTWHSRIRRAITCVYCEPKSRMTICSVACKTSSLPHADALHGLENLAFGLDGGSDDDLRLLKFTDAARPDVAHAGGQG